MDDDQKWLEAAAGIQEDIYYLQAALKGCYANDAQPGIENDIQCLTMALAVYRKNAAAGVPWPSPDDLFCIQSLPHGAQQISTATRRDFKVVS